MAGVTLDDAIQQVPWPLVLAGFSILVVLLLFRRRHDVLDRVGLTKAWIAILCVGPLAGLTVNIPLYQAGQGVLAVNLGGALVPILLVAVWMWRANLNPWLAIAGTFAVSVVAKLIVTFDPDQGIYTSFPQLFAPSLVALAFAMGVSVRAPLRAIPLAYTCGSMGALLGADLYNLPPILAHLRTTRELSVLSIGGAGVFDMVYLAGMVAMAAALVIVAGTLPRREAREAWSYGTMPTLEDPRSAWERYRLVAQPHPRERARASLALSDLYLLRHDYARAVGHAYGAVHALLAAQPGLWERTRREGPEGMRADLDALVAAYRASLETPTPRRVAGSANKAAKLLVAALEEAIPEPSQLPQPSRHASEDRA